ncbi:MAG: prephenate dehydrogenase [Actinomycetota bacterium]|nr:prephenate dehydrogenase [Actinomycetota bacterium]
MTPARSAGSGTAPALVGSVLVIGTGLIGTSVALSLRRAGVDVLLEDVDPANVAIAIDAGAGRSIGPADAPSVVVVAVPPRHAAGVLAQASLRFPSATLTDVTSVKGRVIEDAVAAGADATRLVGGHPMAGREVSGAAGARGDLLDDRLWVLTPLPVSGIEHVRQVHRLVSTCGAYPVEMTLDGHDAAVALVSHTPQLLSSVLAGQLATADEDHVRIAGQGLRDMTRIAGSNVDMWSDILAVNAGPVAEVIERVADELARTAQALRDLADGGHGSAPADLVEAVLAEGVAGQRRIPGKHGAAPSAYREVFVMLADRAGELGRLFGAVGEAGVNLEDVRIEHVLGRPSGLVALFVRPEAGDALVGALGERGFDVRA